MPNPPCEIDYKDDDAGQTQICLTQPPKPGKRRVGGKWCCEDCLDFLKAEIKKRSGASALNIWQAMLRSN